VGVAHARDAGERGGDGIIRFMSLLDTAAFDARLVALKATLDELLAKGQ
jgi:hypothetical protein